MHEWSRKKNTHSILPPGVLNGRSCLLGDDALLHVIQCWVLTNLFFKWQMVLRYGSIHACTKGRDHKYTLVRGIYECLLMQCHVYSQSTVQAAIIMLICCLLEHLDNSSHSTRPQAYMSMRRKASRWKLMAPSNTSGAMYLLVPTCNTKKATLNANLFY